MANPAKRVRENVPGDFFVDTTCIDCDTCRQIAPEVFAEGRDTAYVHAQPGGITDRRNALRALLACPTGSIGDRADDDRKSVMTDFPLLVEAPVYYCGFNSPKSFGGNSYFIEHPGGNWLVDWGASRYVDELTPTGEIVFRLKFNSVFTYRAVPIPPGQLSLSALIAGMNAMYPRSAP